jgi:uncharacterized membrane protein (UPF0182 family)
MRRTTPFGFFITLLGVVAVALAIVRNVLVDWPWFDALECAAVFLTIWKAQLAAFRIAVGRSGGMLAVIYSPRTT